MAYLSLTHGDQYLDSNGICMDQDDVALDLLITTPFCMMRVVPLCHMSNV